MSDKPLVPWVIAAENGRIITGHCNCMAGLGESCSHVASLLWAIESGVRARDSLTVTQKKAYWVIPKAIKEVQYAPAKDIQFQGKKRALSSLASSKKSSSPQLNEEDNKSPNIPVPTDAEVDKFYSSLSSCQSKPAILALVEPYCNSYVPSTLDEGLPKSLSLLYSPENQRLNYNELLQKGVEVQITVTAAEAALVETQTRGQTRSRLWFAMRAGRVTASRFKSACCTDPASPSLSLIMSICHPQTLKFKTAATVWGCEHESSVRISYEEIMSKTHQSFKVSECGLFICVEHPYIGASPDGLVSCSCCGDGICEIKVGIY
jgi:hypothetical protein